MNERQLQELLDSFLDQQVSFRQVEQEFDLQGCEVNVAVAIQEHSIAAIAVDQLGVLNSIKRARKNFEATADAPIRSLVNPEAAEVPVRSINWINRAAAVAAVFVAALGLWTVFTIGGYSTEQMYADLNEPYTLNTVRSSNTIMEGDMVDAFRSGNYEKVIALYQGGTTYTSREMFFSGYSFMQMEDFTSAAVNFEKLLQNNAANGQLLYNDDAEYYLAVSRMRIGNYESAYDLSRRIYDTPAHTYNSSISWLQLAKLWWLK